MTLYIIGTILNLASIYMIAGVGCLVCLKAGAINLGGEGQIYLGGFVAAVVLASGWCTKLPAPIALIIAFILAMCASALLSLFSGFLSYRKHADYLFTSFIISAAIIPVIDGLIAGPARAKEGNLLATPFFKESFRLPSLLSPSTLNISFFVGIILCVYAGYFFKYKKSGRITSIFGITPKFAHYSGFHSKQIIYSVSIVSGALHGLCGALAIAGTYYTCHFGFYSSMGWNSLTASLLASGNPVFLIPASIFFAGIIYTSDSIAMYQNFGFDMSYIIQAFILFGIACVRRRENDS